ncbi:MAG: DUF167 domain-containing protein [Leptospiraceae bacterium]|nr:DUF167 domain-containing protein [Leptospiraceae bacterium]MCP5503076.1 DUF167 domain-containing protein [Leptospiraceae bacterium]
MKVSVTVKPGSKKPGIEELDPENWIVRVQEPATDGKANAAVIKAIAAYKNIAKSKVKIILGEKSKKKLIEISS